MLLRRLQENKSNVLIVAISLGAVSILVLTPISRLFISTTNEYVGPQNLLFPRRELFAFYISICIFLAVAYYQIIKLNSRHLNKYLLLTSVLLVVVVAIFTYPSVYDPLYYHFSAQLWVANHINPYLSLVDAVSRIQFPVISVPVLHNYAYGPVWLILTVLIGIAVRFNYLFFSAGLTLIAGASLIAASFVAQTLKKDFDVKFSIFLLLFNPVVLLFALPSGNQEPLAALMLILGVAFVKKHKELFTGTFLALACAIKISLFAPSLIIFIWSLVQNNSGSTRSRFVKLMAPFAIVFGLSAIVFGGTTRVLSGLQTFVHIEQTHGLTIGSLLAYSSSEIIKRPDLLPAILNICHLLLNTIFFVILFRYVVKIMRREPVTLMTLGTWLWKVIILQIYLLGISMKPWYIIPALVMSLLLNRRYRLATALITLFYTIGAEYLTFTIEYPQGTTVGTAVFLIVIGITVAIPVLIVFTVDESTQQRLNIWLRSWIQKIIPLAPSTINLPPTSKS
ncbi:hypothetical protein KC614_02750 [candidate division WWE3 bacterium]|uniref:Uncharacterized protein n=1 Tax=candidate division WWE3 bacterium TaxID=2053526 RepID=A0A955LKY1_UNCKA|nr:hypothetical protein [candidate division WWE3 bacterium]